MFSKEWNGRGSEKSRKVKLCCFLGCETQSPDSDQIPHREWGVSNWICGNFWEKSAYFVHFCSFSSTQFEVFCHLKQKNSGKAANFNIQFKNALSAHIKGANLTAKIKEFWSKTKEVHFYHFSYCKLRIFWFHFRSN